MIACFREASSFLHTNQNVLYYKCFSTNKTNSKNKEIKQSYLKNPHKPTKRNTRKSINAIGKKNLRCGTTI